MKTVGSWQEMDHTAPSDTGTSPLAIWGIIGGLLMPIIGLVIALILLARGQVGPGLAAILASCLGVFAALLLLA